jgi:hypothetical protein
MLIAREVLGVFLAKHGLGWYPENDREAVAHDATARLMERIARRGDDYPIRFIRSVLRRELQRQIFDKERVEWGQLGDLAGFDCPDGREPMALADDRDAFADLLDLPDGRRIILEIYFARTFKGLVLRLATFKPQAWIYDHAGDISSVYKNTRAMKCRERKKGRLSGSPGISPLTRVLTRPFRTT